MRNFQVGDCVTPIRSVDGRLAGDGGTRGFSAGIALIRSCAKLSHHPLHGYILMEMTGRRKVCAPSTCAERCKMNSLLRQLLAVERLVTCRSGRLGSRCPAGERQLLP